MIPFIQYDTLLKKIQYIMKRDVIFKLMKERIFMRKIIILLLTAAILISTLPVTAEAKKLGKVQMGNSEENPYDYDEKWNVGLGATLYCRPGDTFTFNPMEYERKIKALNRIGLNYVMESDGKAIWRSTNPEVATVNQKGKVTVKSDGIAAITLSCEIRTRNMGPNPKWETSERCLYRHWIRSGKDEVLELKPTNLKSIAKKATKFEQTTDTRRFVRIKGSIQDNKELFLTYLEEVKKNRKKEIADGSLDWKEPKIEEYLYHNGSVK